MEKELGQEQKDLKPTPGYSLINLQDCLVKLEVCVSVHVHVYVCV